MSASNLQANLKAIGQEQVLKFFDSLSPDGKKKLTDQLQALDLHNLSKLVQTYVTQKPPLDIPHHFDPVKAYPHQAGPDQKSFTRKPRSAATSCSCAERSPPS